MSEPAYIRAKEVVSANMDGEPVIMSMEHNMYFGITGIGAVVWDLLVEAHRISDLVAIISARYDVDTDTCCNDIAQLLKDLQKNGLVRVV